MIYTPNILMIPSEFDPNPIQIMLSSVHSSPSHPMANISYSGHHLMSAQDSSSIIITNVTVDHLVMS